MPASVRRCSVCHVVYSGNERFCPSDAGAIVEAVEAEAGSRVGQTIDGRYLVRRMLGRGGMGEVYEADHVGLDKRVAIKFITSDNKNPNALARFRREARVASKIVHEHVVQIFDVGSDTGGDYIVMEYLEGKDLKQVLADGRLSLERSVAIARQMLAGLAAIHDANILHRDIKPANVLLTTRGEDRDFVKIMDFGISKSIAGDDGLTLTGTGNVIGTPEYIAPETLRGQDADHRGDLYAVGITLYAMLAGIPPFAATAFERVVAMHLSEPPPPIAGLPGWLTAVIDRALAKTPEQRFPDARSFAKALVPPKARAEIIDEPVAPMAKSKMPLIAAIVGVALVLGIVALVLGLRGRSPGSPVVTDAPIAIDAPTTAAQSLAIARRAATDGNYAFAIAAYADAFKLAPTPDLAKEIAALAVATHHNADAATYYREYLRIAPDAPDKAAIAELVANLDAVLDAGVVADAPTPDAPVALAIDATLRDPNGLPISSPKTDAMYCRCDAGPGPLCRTNAESRCSCFSNIDALCPGPMAGESCPDNAGYANFNQLGHHAGEPCRGFNRTDKAARGGVYECRVCQDYSAFGFRGQTGDECNGFDKGSGRPTVGRLQCRATP